MQAIETRYKGYRFRSRLEARWAVFLDALGIEWLYEHEGYKLSTGLTYLPDFLLYPSHHIDKFLEVKPLDIYDDFISHNTAEREKAKALAFDSKGSVITVFGLPGKECKAVMIECDETGKYDTVGTKGNIGLCNLCERDFPHFLFIPDNLAVSKREIKEIVKREHVSNKEAKEYLLWRNAEIKRRTLNNPQIVLAEDIARSARFEFGESG